MIRLQKAESSPLTLDKKFFYCLICPSCDDASRYPFNLSTTIPPSSLNSRLVYTVLWQTNVDLPQVNERDIIGYLKFATRNVSVARMD